MWGGVSLTFLHGKKWTWVEQMEIPAPVFLHFLLGHAWCVSVCLSCAVSKSRLVFGIIHRIQNCLAILNPYENMRGNFCENVCQCFRPAFISELKLCNKELHVHANKEPTSLLSFLSTLTTAQSITKRLNVGIYAWRAFLIMWLHVCYILLYFQVLKCFDKFLHSIWIKAILKKKTILNSLMKLLKFSSNFNKTATAFFPKL